MTTIAYKDGVIAYDSRVTMDNLIIDDESEKHDLVDGVHFFYCGATSDNGHLINAYINNCTHTETRIDGNALVVDSEGLFYIGVNHENQLWKAPIRLGSHFAIGSGADFAFAFMDSGMSAVEAVKMTARRDSATGGVIRSFDIKRDLGGNVARDIICA